MSDRKKPKLSDIRARHEVLANRLSNDTDIPYLLDLVERMGEATKLIGEMADEVIQECAEKRERTEVVCALLLGRMDRISVEAKEARALVEELRQ